MESYLAELRLVSQAVLAVSRPLSTRDALEVIVGSARTLVGAAYAALGVPDDAGSFAEFVVAGMTQAQQRAIGPLPRQHGMLAAMLTAGAPERLADIRKDPRFGGWWPAAHPELTGFLGVPVKNGDEVLGIIFVANKSAGEFTDRDEELLTLFAAHAAIALTNARLYERSRELVGARGAGPAGPGTARRGVAAAVLVRARAGGQQLIVEDPARSGGRVGAIAELGAEADARAPRRSRRTRAARAGARPGRVAAPVGGGGRARRTGSRSSSPRADAPHWRRGADRPCCGSPRRRCTTRCGTPARARCRWRCRGPDAGSVLEIADNGTGFDPALASAGLGLTSMRERAAAVGGALRINSTPGTGTTVRMEVPT